MGAGKQIDHTETIAASDPAVEVAVLMPISRSRGQGRAWVSWIQEAAGKVSFVPASDTGAHTAYQTEVSALPNAASMYGEAGGEDGLPWLGDGVLGFMYSDTGPINVLVTVAVDPGV